MRAEKEIRRAAKLLREMVELPGDGGVHEANRANFPKVVSGLFDLGEPKDTEELDYCI